MTCPAVTGGACAEVGTWAMRHAAQAAKTAAATRRRVLERINPPIERQCLRNPGGAKRGSGDSLCGPVGNTFREGDFHSKSGREGEERPVRNLASKTFGAASFI